MKRAQRVLKSKTVSACERGTVRERERGRKEERERAECGLGWFWTNFDNGSKTI